MPEALDEEVLAESILSANSLADLQPGAGYNPRFYSQATLPDPVNTGARISPADLAVVRDKFPMLNEFSTEFLRDRTIDELLRIESTSMRIKDS